MRRKIMAKSEGAHIVERELFLNACRETHGKMRRCFMTGKPCVSEEMISRRLEEVHSKKRPPEGFVIMAYRPNLNAFYDWSLARLFQSQYGTEAQVLKRADQVRRTGYVICEKICRRIQESSFVVVDVSIDNANVFYEFGLAYGLRHKMLIIHDVNSVSAAPLKRRFLPDSMQHSIYIYPSLKSISPTETFSQRLHDLPEVQFPESLRTGNPQIAILDLRVDGISESELSAKKDSSEKKDNQDQKDSSQNQGIFSTPPKRQYDIPLTFMDLIKGAIGVSLENIAKNLEDQKKEQHIPSEYLGLIRAMKNDIKEFGADTPFETIRSAIENAFCVLIRTSKTHPFSYFWLGYCHATGKNAIPIYEVADDKEDIEDLAFDIRSLWHLVLVRNQPTRILSELEEIMDQMILTDFAERSRKAFWSRVFGRSGRVHIFTGALHSPDFHREMVGDWDLRTASELTSYFSTHQLLSTIESPIYQPEHVKIELDKYLEELASLLTDKNAIVIASPDVNPMTELLLGRLYGVQNEELFRSSFYVERYPRAIASVKKRDIKGNPTNKKAMKARRFFFIEEPSSRNIEERGFKAAWLKGNELLKEYLGQKQCTDKDFKLYAHLVVALNPFATLDQAKKQEDHYVVILNGISGPSTFALTHLLTGGIGTEFVDYSGRPVGHRTKTKTKVTPFDPDIRSESILKKVTEKLDQYIHEKSDFCGVQAIVEVTVGPLTTHAKQLSTYDSRRVKSWKLVPGTLTLIEKAP
jgi:hypothetical protein